MCNTFLKLIFGWTLIFSGSVASGVAITDTVLSIANFLSQYEGSEAPSVELQLLKVRLGAPYAKTKELLTQLYGAPHTYTAPSAFDVFLLDKKTENILIIHPHEKDPALTGAVQVSGTHPIKGLNFFANINLGDAEKNILFKFPKAKPDPVLKDGYRHYNIPLANYSIEAKDGKVASFRIRDEYTMTFRNEGKSISLTQNLLFVALKNGMLKKHLDIDKLTELSTDTLRPYCRSRYPMRLSSNGMSYADITVYSDKMEPVPATFMLETGWRYTAITPEMCKKINCQLLRTESSPGSFVIHKITSGGAVGFGQDVILLDEFNLQQSEANTLQKIEGSVGIDVFFSKGMLLNFKQGYLCFPSQPVPKVAQALQFKKVEAQYDNRVWLDFRANGYLLKDYFLDTGSDITSFLEKDRFRLGLQKTSKEEWRINASGRYKGSFYGPVDIGWPSLGITQTLKETTQAPNKNFRKIGMDFLRHYIVGLDSDTNYFYLGE